MQQRILKAIPEAISRMWQFITENPALITVCFIFMLTTGLLSCTWFRYQINPDATSYFTIAIKYAHFDFRHAINGYWGPLLSWLIVPYIWLHIDPAIGARLTSILAAVGLLMTFYCFVRRRHAGQTVAIGFVLVLAMTLMVWILTGPVTPDLLMAFFTVLFAMQLRSFLATPIRQQALRLGAIGAAMYFCKGFGFYLFIAVCAIIALTQYWQTHWAWKSLLKQWLPVVILFVVLTVPFIGLLSIKYGHLTINNAGSFDHRAYGPVMLGNEPQAISGPLAPPNATANTIWEDPSYMIKLMPNWSPLQSRAYLHFFIFNTFLDNLKLSLQAFYTAGVLFIAAGLMLIIGCFGVSYRREYLLFTLVAVIQIAGYASVLTDPRYLWSGLILALVALALWIAQNENKKILSHLQIAVGMTIIVVFVALPIPQEISGGHRGAIESYRQMVNIGKFVPPGSKVIADNFGEYYPCYYLKLHCYSVLSTPSPDTGYAYYRQLRNLGIEYYIDYHTRDKDMRLTAFVQTYFSKAGAVTTVPSPTLSSITTIYKLKP